MKTTEQSICKYYYSIHCFQLDCQFWIINTLSSAITSLMQDNDNVFSRVCLLYMPFPPRRFLRCRTRTAWPSWPSRWTGGTTTWCTVARSQISQKFLSQYFSPVNIKDFLKAGKQPGAFSSCVSKNQLHRLFWTRQVFAIMNLSNHLKFYSFKIISLKCLALSGTGLTRILI